MMKFRGHKKTADRLLEGVCLLLVLAALVNPGNVQGRPADYMNAGNIRNFNFGTWTGIGGVSSTNDACFASANDNNRNPPPSASTMPYQVKVESTMGPGGDFYIYLDDDTGNTGNRRIRVTIEHRDIIDGNGWEQLGYDTWDNHSHNGQFRGCQDNGNNTEVRVSINAFEMAGKISGRYRGEFSITGIGGESGNATDSDTFMVILRVDASPEVRISNLDNFNLGTHSGLGNIYAEENFCVFSSSASGSYSISVSSGNQDGGGNFYLNNAFGLGQIPYDLYFTDAASGPGTVKVSSASLSGFGDAGDQFCGGGNNATLSVQIAEQALQQAKSGSYQDSLVILVAPQ